jgi:outer membrane protein assembly factor BamA
MNAYRWLAAAAVAGTLATPAAAQGPDVVELQFQGNRAFTRAELLPAIETQAPNCRLLFLCWVGWGVEPAQLNPQALEADAFRLKVYYYERGYREAQIQTDTTIVGPGEVQVVFRVEEGRPVRVSAVEINGLPDDVSGEGLPLRTGRSFDVVAYEATRDTLQARLRNNGYARGQVLLGYTIQREAPYEAAVQYDAYPGDPTWFGEITVDGTEQISPDLVHRMLSFDEGDPYDRSALLRSQRDLYGLQIFRFADVQADLEAEPDSLIPVLVRVAEGNMRRVRLEAGINSLECGTLEGQWTNRNFLGGGRRVTVRGRLGNLLIRDCTWLVPRDVIPDTTKPAETYLASVDLTQPWFFGPRNALGIGLFTERSNLPDVFIREAYGGYISLSRSLGSDAALTLAYRPERTKLTTDNELVFCVNFVACTADANIIGQLTEFNLLAPLTLSLTVDRTDDVFAPSRGFILQVDMEHAAAFTGSTFEYSRVLAEGSQYVGEPGGMILATRVRGGVAFTPDDGTGQAVGLYPQARFFAGGANSVRGLRQFRLGPRVLGIDAVPYLVNGDTGDASAGPGCMRSEIEDETCDASPVSQGRFQVFPTGGEAVLEGNVELRFPLPYLGGRLRGAVFVDAGWVWEEAKQFAQLRDMLATPGFGFRYQSPIGPIRVDAAFNTLGPQDIEVLTTQVEPCTLDQAGCRRVEGRVPRVTLRNSAEVAVLPEIRYGSALGKMDSLADFLNRFQLHFSIGQAF